MFEITLTEEKIREDFKKLKELNAKFLKLSDEEIKPINEEFYGVLEIVSRIAEENNLDASDAYSYYKLSMWLEMCEKNK